MNDYFKQRLDRLEREAVRAIKLFIGFALISVLSMLIFDKNNYVIYTAYAIVVVSLLYTTYKVYYYDIEREMFENKTNDDVLMNKHLKRDAIESIFKNIAIFLGCFILLLGLEMVVFVAMFKQLNLFNPPLGETTRIFILGFCMVVLVIAFQLFFGKKMQKALYEIAINFKYIRGIDKDKKEAK